MAEGRARASPKEELPEEALQAFGPPPTWGSKRKRRTDESRRSHAAATGAPGSSKKPKAEQVAAVPDMRQANGSRP